MEFPFVVSLLTSNAAGFATIRLKWKTLQCSLYAVHVATVRCNVPLFKEKGKSCNTLLTLPAQHF